LSLSGLEAPETHSERVGFVFPVYLSSIPVPVRKFLRKLDLKSSRYIFAIATRAGSMSMADVCLEKILRKKGKALNFFAHLNMATNSPVGLMPPNFPGLKEKVENWIHEISAERITKMDAEVQNQLDSIQKVIVNQGKNSEKTNPLKSLGKPLRWLLAALMESLSENSKSEIRFYTDETCSGCGVCEQVCLSKKVKMVNQKPVWQKEIQCYFCYACFNYCPAQSILVQDSYTRRNGRYFHPGISAADIGGQK
jgi:Pyruvate/2-oxoacid:ferredoxin oxidoreductase delta subunit